MDPFDLHRVTPKPGRKARRVKSLYERARKYVGAIRMPDEPRKGAANVKALTRAQVAAKHSR